MASAYAAVVAGGYHNTASTAQAVVGGGYVNVASGTSSTVSGGAWNVASGNGAAVVGGLRNKATGLRSLAAGQGAVASHAHSAVLGFNSTGDTCLSNGEGTVSICADAGLYLNGYRYNVTDDVHQNAADIAVLSDEVVALWTLGAALVQNDSALSTRVARVELDSADLLANATAMQLELAQCNAQVLAQTAQISQLSSTVIALNATVRTQDLTISSLEDRVDQLNANISSMSDALQMLLSAAAFTTVPVDCEYDGNLAVTGGAPCDSAPQSTAGHAFSTTSIAAQNDASTVPLPVSEAPSVVKPNVTARSTSHLTNGQTSLPPGSAATLELSTSVPPSSDATSTTTATATTATVTTTTTTTTTTIGPPTLHDMSIDFVSSTPVLTKFRVSVNATTEASGRMTYAYRLIQKTASSQLISYDVAFSYADTLLFEVPSTRDFFVEVSIRNDADSGASPMRTSCMVFERLQFISFDAVCSAREQKELTTAVVVVECSRSAFVCGRVDAWRCRNNFGRELPHRRSIQLQRRYPNQRHRRRFDGIQLHLQHICRLDCVVDRVGQSAVLWWVEVSTRFVHAVCLARHRPPLRRSE